MLTRRPPWHGASPMQVAYQVHVEVRGLAVGGLSCARGGLMCVEVVQVTFRASALLRAAYEVHVEVRGFAQPVCFDAGWRRAPTICRADEHAVCY